MSKNLEHKQYEYYARTAHKYDAMQLHENDEHYNALMFLQGLVIEKQYQSLLDVGCGTGRALIHLQGSCPNLSLTGIEPVEELGLEALSKGLESDQVICGDGRSLPFEDSSFDCVTAFGILHHIQDPGKVISEMFRVAKRAVFISDHNIYGWDNQSTRMTKQVIRKVFGFQMLKFLMTKGRGYHDSTHDGIYYPSSLFDYCSDIAHHSNQMLVISTKGKAWHLYSEASHLAVFANLDSIC